jgi:hypothetical protein
LNPRFNLGLVDLGYGHRGLHLLFLLGI